MSEEQQDETTEPKTEFGEVTWHSSDEDSGPDVGLSLGLGLGRMLWVGEAPDRHGWWLSIYDPNGREDFAKFEDACAARQFFEEIEAMIRHAQQSGHADHNNPTRLTTPEPVADLTDGGER